MRPRTSSEPPPPPWRLGLALAAIAATLFAAVLAGRPPAPLAAGAPADRFSAGRAFRDVEAVARAPHPTGSAENARVRAYLGARLRALGLTVETQAAPLSERARRRLKAWGEGDAAAGTNLVGVLPGADRAAPAVVMMAHHDSVSGSPGAADDGAGVAVILETVRALAALPDRRRDLVVVFTDAEELNLDGAAAFLASPLARRAGAVINLEARGGAGRALMFETGPDDGPLVALYARAAPRPSTQSLAVFIYRLLPNSSDFTLAKGKRLSGLNIAFLGGAGLYHAPQSTAARTDRGSVQHMGQQALGVARALIAAPALPGRGPDLVFGDVLGLFVLAYRPAVGWALVAGAALLLAVAAVRARAVLSPAGIALGAGGALWATFSAAILLWGFNQVSRTGRGPAVYYDRLAALPQLELQAGLIGLAVLLLLAARTSASPLSRWLGAGLVVLVLAAGVQAAAPMAAPLVAWPLLATAAAAALAALIDPRLERPAALAASAAVGVPAAAQTLGIAHFAFLGVGADMPEAASLFGLLAALPLVPVLAGAVSRRSRRLAAAILLVAALGVALSVRLDAPAETIPTYARR